MSSSYHLLIRRWLRKPVIQLLLTLLAIFALVDLLVVYPTYRRLAPFRIQHLSKDPTPPPGKYGKVFITASIKNSAALIEQKWRPSLVELVKRLGPENVYVSIVESGSYDSTYLELAKLNMDLMTLLAMRKLQHSDLPFDEEVRTVFPTDEHGDGEGWVDAGLYWGKRLRRIPWLAHLRNKQLEPMYEAERDLGLKFDRIVFLNDVWFEAEDVLKLLGARGGEYDAVCGLDFSRGKGWSKGVRFYDTFATRDKRGLPVASTQYPYFGEGVSRDMLQQGKLIPVNSCWGGVAVFDAKPFLGNNSTRLKFRALPDSAGSEHLEASECCLINYDNAQRQVGGKGAWMDPSVRFGYSREAYDDVHPRGGWPTFSDVRDGVWQNAWVAAFRLPWIDIAIRPAYVRWKAATENKEENAYDCLVNEKQISDVLGGWAHI